MKAKVEYHMLMNLDLWIIGKLATELGLKKEPVDLAEKFNSG